MLYIYRYVYISCCYVVYIDAYNPRDLPMPVFIL